MNCNFDFRQRDKARALVKEKNLTTARESAIFQDKACCRIVLISAQPFISFFFFFESFLSGILSTPLDFGNKESGSSYSQARLKPLII